jgi:hypothetical protein
LKKFIFFAFVVLCSFGAVNAHAAVCALNNNGLGGSHIDPTQCAGFRALLPSPSRSTRSGAHPASTRRISSARGSLPHVPSGKGWPRSGCAYHEKVS